MAQRAPKSEAPEKPWSIFGDEPLPDGWGFPVYLDGKIVDWYVPPEEEEEIDLASLPTSTRDALELFGAWSDLDPEETEADSNGSTAKGRSRRPSSTTDGPILDRHGADDGLVGRPAGGR